MGIKRGDTCMIDFLVGNAAVVLEDVVVSSSRGGSNLLEGRLLRWHARSAC